PGRLRFDLRASALRTQTPPAFSGLLAEGISSYRGSIGIEHRSEHGRLSLVLRENAAAMFGDTTLLQEGAYFGGPVSLPGYAQHQVAGKYGSATRIELQLPIPWVSIPLGRFGRLPGEAKLA